MMENGFVDNAFVPPMNAPDEDGRGMIEATLVPMKSSETKKETSRMQYFLNERTNTNYLSTN